MPSQAEFDALRGALAEAQVLIKQQETALERLQSPPLGRAAVLRTDKDGLVLLAQENGGLVEVAPPEKIKLLVGDTVLIDIAKGAIINKSRAIAAGDVVMLSKIHDDIAEVNSGQGGSRTIYLGQFQGKAKEGDKVLLNPSGHLVVRVFEKEPERFDFTIETQVTWNDIGGQEEAKRQMIEAVELPRKHPEVFAHYGKKPVKGILLYGPPGCGKTMFGKAAANAIAKIHGGNRNAPSGFMYVKGPEVLDPYVGVAEATIRTLFERARQHHRVHGFPAVLFIDEADALLSKRGERYAHMEKTIVPMFLSEMDGLEASGALVILATNRPDSLDPAVVRDGRIDRKVRVGRPGPKDAEAIFMQYLKKVPTKGKPADLAETAREALFCPKKGLYHVRIKGEAELLFTLGQTISGAMINGIVDKATSIALHRDLDNGRTSSVTSDDLVAAVEQVFKDSRDLDHTETLIDFAHPKEIDSVAKA